MNWPKVSIIIITYDRPREIRITIDALKKHLKYDGELLYHLADDGTPGIYLAKIAEQYQDLNFTMAVTPRLGFGANANKSILNCLSRSDYYFFIEDDRPPKKDFDLNRAVALLSSKDDSSHPQAVSKREPIGLVRMDGIAGHWFNLELREAQTQIGNVPYFRVMRNSPFLNVYSNRIHLVHRRFRDFHGEYANGLSLGDTESNYAHRIKKKKGPWIVSLINGIEMTHDHIGRSRQLTEKDPNYKA